MKVLGINHDMYISSAAIVIDGDVVAACAEERLNRDKRSRVFPLNSIKYCLAEAGVKLEDLDGVANSYNPAFHMQKFNPIISNSRRARSDYLYAVPDHLMRLVSNRASYTPDYMKQEMPLPDGGMLNTYFVTHHLCHAANAFYLSPYSEAAILTADGRGEHDTCTFGLGESGKISIIKRQSIPQSLGSFYSTFTDFLGFQSDGDEWKVMALASMAESNNKYYSILRNTVNLNGDGTFILDGQIFKEFIQETPGCYTSKLIDLIGPPRGKNDPLDARHFEIAAAMQKVTEDILVHMLNWLKRESGLNRVCVGGGVFMNSVFNGRIVRLTEFSEVFISSCPDDSGLSIGAALWLNQHLSDGAAKRVPQLHNYYGPAYTNDEIERTLIRYKLRYRKSADVEAETAQLLSEGRLVGWMQGRCEFGQRALGNRSILADPRALNTKDAVNAAVKFREAFRPFAPAILIESVGEYFDIEPSVSVPFMERVYPIKASKQKIIPAVTHFDGSGRLQTVDNINNPRFYGLISAFKKITGVPVLLNTSFNVNGEPIVCSPTDAIKTFHSCGLDVLVIGDYIVEK
jgi:carbamoyltransferase